MVKLIYRIYQLFIALPLIAIYTVITCLMVIIGCALGNGHFWGYYPGKWWAQFIVRVRSQSSGSLRYIPDLRISVPQLQVDDEAPAASDAPRGQGMRVCPPHIR